MARVREIRKRITSVKSIAQVTRAMQTVAASRMHHSQAALQSARIYARRFNEMFADLEAHLTAEQRQASVLLSPGPVQTIGLILVTGSRGLCGGYNHNVIRAAMDFIDEQQVPVRLVTIGTKGRDYAHRHEIDTLADFGALPERPLPEQTRPVARLLIEDLEQGTVDQVWLAYTEFVNTLVQRPKVQILLPLQPSMPVEPVSPRIEYLFEPNLEALLNPVLHRFAEFRVHLAILESKASEQAARMLAMRGATENASRLIDELSLSYNKARQESITMELIDIVSGATALSEYESAAHR